MLNNETKRLIVQPPLYYFRCWVTRVRRYNRPSETTLVTISVRVLCVLLLLYLLFSVYG